MTVLTFRTSNTASITIDLDAPHEGHMTNIYHKAPSYNSSNADTFSQTTPEGSSLLPYYMFDIFTIRKAVELPDIYHIAQL